MNGYGTKTAGTGNGRWMRCALFVDFDNVYQGLRQLDPKAAEAFASNPARWLERLENGRDAEGEFRRRFLVRACYLNPSVSAQFRPFFTRAGFRVIDCPSLTQQGKSSADINMVLDAVDALSAPTRYDEFIILSADADFTPLALRCRAADRRVTIIVAGPVARAYRAVADSVLNADDLAEILTGPALPDVGRATLAGSAGTKAPELAIIPGKGAEPISAASTSAVPTAAGPVAALVAAVVARAVVASAVAPGAGAVASGVDPAGAVPAAADPAGAAAAGAAGAAAAGAGAGNAVLRLLRSAAGPVAGSAMAQAAQHVDQTLPASSWDGHGGFVAWLLASVPEAGWSSRPSPGYGWDQRRFTEADLPTGYPAGLTPLQRQVANVTDIPSLGTKQYATLLKALADDVNANPFHRAETSKRVRDSCQEAGAAVGRASINSVIQGLLYSNLKLEPPVSAEELARGWAGNVEGLCGDARMELDDDRQAQVRSWVGGDLIVPRP